MSVRLQQEGKSELPLIAFTTCIPAAEGIAILAFMPAGGVALAALAWLLASIGMAASIAHLAKPLRAPRALLNLDTSWLSREIAVVGAFWGALLLWLAAELLGCAGVGLAFEAVAVIIGICLLAVIAEAYKVSTRPAWCGSEGLGELWAGACGMGSAAVALGISLSPAPPSPDVYPLVLGLLGASSLLGLALDVACPRHRKARLLTLLNSSDERVSLTLENYERLWPRITRLWLCEGSCATLLIGAVLCMAMGASWHIAQGVLIIAFVAQLIIHGWHRSLFYELPIQVRWVASLRK